MDAISGYVYHIKDEFFDKVKDDKLMANKEGGNYRPTYFCVKDDKTSLLWVIPMSSRIEKYQKIYDRQVEKYGRCITIVIGVYDGKQSAFLLQNMFPITSYYLDHIHTRNGNPVPVNSVIQEILLKDFRAVKNLIDRNITIVFPNIKNIEKIMLEDFELKSSMDEHLLSELETLKEKPACQNIGHVRNNKELER